MIEVKNTINLSSIIDIDTNKAIINITSDIENITDKPERIYCNDYYNECHTPKLIVQTDLYDKNISQFRKYSIGYLNKTFYPLKIDRNLKQNSINITLKEIWYKQDYIL